MNRKTARSRAPNSGPATASVVKNMILEALDRAGGVEYLSNQAEENPRIFLSLLTKVISLDDIDESDEPVAEVVRWAETEAEAIPDPSRR